MVFVVKQSHVPSPERRLHRKVEKATIWMSLKTNVVDNLLVGGTGLVLQEEVIFE
jgi:hypothetical protein